MTTGRWIAIIVGTAFTALSCGPFALADTNASVNTSTRRSPEVSAYDRPTWAVEFAMSPAAFGDGLAPGRPDADAMGTTLQIEYQPAFIQSLGALSAGPVFAAYPSSPRQGVTNNYFAVWSVGAAARYQARFAHNQILVPSIGYEIDRLHYSFTGGQVGNAIVSGPVAGLQLLLNALDTRRGDAFYDLTGISHLYLVGEVRDLTGTDGVVSASNVSWYFGLRMEM